MNDMKTVLGMIATEGSEPLPAEATPENHRHTLLGVALFLVSEMEGDNGCSFAVSFDQAEKLNTFHFDSRIDAVTVGDLKTLASGEHGDQLDVIAKNPDLLQPISDLLNDIFENPSPSSWAEQERGS